MNTFKGALTGLFIGGGIPLLAVVIHYGALPWPDEAWRVLSIMPPAFTAAGAWLGHMLRA